MRTAATVLFLMLLRVAPVAAQVVRGTVLEQGSGPPIDGAMVIVMDGAEHVVARSLTDDEGRFLARVEHPGRYHVRIDRIGYESLTTEPFDVPPEGTSRNLRVPLHPVELAGLDVSGSRRCALRTDVGLATATVWAEARKALEAAAWTLHSGQYGYTLLHFVRQLDRGGRTVIHEERNFVKGYGQAPYVSRPARVLSDSGFVRELPDGSLTYFAPDAEALLSDAFLDTHCMRLQEGDSGLVGLAFEPIKGRKQADIRGVLWMDTATAMLTRMDFRYVNLNRGPAAGDAGGEVTFGRLPGGTWIVSEWRIRTPILRTIGRRQYGRVGYHDEGGVVWRVTDHSGTIVQEAALATVSGQVMDSLGKKRLAGAVVRARDVSGQAVSDSTGGFVLSGLPGGHLVLGVAYPSLDTLGLVSPDSVAVDVAAGQVGHVHLRVPGVYEVLAAACAGNLATERPPGTAIVFGRVRREGGPAAGATVQTAWLTPGNEVFSASARAAPPGGSGAAGKAPTWTPVDVGGRPWLETTLDDRGTFLLCDVPSPSQLRVVATVGDRSVRKTVTIPRGDRMEATVLTIPPEGGR